MIDHDAAWVRDDECAGRIPPTLRSWLAERGLLSDRVSAASGGTAAFRLLWEGAARLDPGARARLGSTDVEAHERRGEFQHDGRCMIATQSLFPRSALARHPWLVEIGGALLGERLKTAAAVTRDAFEYLELPADHPLSLPAPDPSPPSQVRRRAWARRAVHRIDGAPILVTEVFSPRVTRWAAASTGAVRGA